MLFTSKLVTWNDQHLRFFLYRLYNRFRLIFQQEGIEKDTLLIVNSVGDFWAKAQLTETPESRKLSDLMTRLLRIPHMTQSTDFRVLCDLDIDELQNREIFNSRTKSTLEKLSQVI